MSAPVLLLLGSGPRIGASVAQKFASAGYKVAITGRSMQEGYTPENYFGIKADLVNTESVPSIFERVKAELGTPSVVVYNASTFEKISNGDPLSVSHSALQNSMNVNFISAYIAAQEAAKGFSDLKDGSKTFIYTGNKANLIPIPSIFTNGVGKAATATLINNLVTSHKESGYKFYYADERTGDGSAVYGAVNGEGAGQFYLDLANSKTQQPWLATFVTGKGYVEFSTSLQ